MSLSHPSGLLAAYNSLTDKHLAGYFNNTRIRRHLLRSGLITRSGRILSEKEYKLNIMKRDHQKYIRECLAQAIFHKVLDMERYHQLEIKKKLETLARKEQMQRFKGEPIRWSIEKNKPVLSPHPPVGPKTNRGHSVLVDERRSNPTTLTVPRPYTAPGIVQPPTRLQPLPSNPEVGTVPKVTSRSRSKTSPLESEAPFPIEGKKAMMKFRNSMENSQGMNRYQLLNINGYMIPVLPPLPPPSGKITRENKSGTWRRRRFRPTTAPNSLEPIFTRDSRRTNKTPLHSNAAITMIYWGKNVHLAYDHQDFRDEIKVYQQHCGGENLCVYKGKLLEKETFQFISKRHHGFPFSLTFFLNGMQVNRLSSCCEYKHRKGSRLGGKRGYFGFVCVERSSPCYKCIIATGLDKIPTSPKLSKQNSVERREELKKGEGKLRKGRAHTTPRRNEMERSRSSASVIFSAEEVKTGVEDVRTAVGEMERKGKQHIWEDDQEDIFKYEYEEDFEGYEEKQDGKANEERQADDQMNGKSKSPSDDEKDNVDPEKESETSSQKAPDVDDPVNDERDECSDSELEEDKQDITASSSSRSHPYSSSSEDESILGDREAHAGNSPNESARSSSSQELNENDGPGKSHLSIEDSLKIELEDQKTMKADVETNALLIEQSLEKVPTEETKKGTRVISEDLSEESGKHVSKEVKKNYRSKLWKGSTAKVKDKKASPCGVEKDVGQILAEALELGCRCPDSAEPGFSSTDGEKHLTEPETETAPNKNFMVEESKALHSNKESKPVASEMYTLEKEEAVEEEEVPQHRDTNTIEDKGGVTPWGKAGIDEVPLGEWKPPAEQPALAELYPEERENPQGLAIPAEARGDGKLDEEGLNSVGKNAGLTGGEVPETQTALETEKTASEEERGAKAVLASQAAALSPGRTREAAAPTEAVMAEEEGAEEGAAGREAVSEKPGVEDSEGEKPIDLEAMGPKEDATSASEREDGSEEAAVGGEEAAWARKAAQRAAPPLSSRAAEQAGAAGAGAGASGGSPRGLREKEGSGTEAEAESNEDDNSREAMPEELASVARERPGAERPEAPPGQTEPERGGLTRANALQDEDTLEEEQKLNREGGNMGQDVRPEEGTEGPPSGLECDAEKEAAMVASEPSADPGPQGEAPPGERGVAVFGTAPGLGTPPESIVAVRTEEVGRRLGEAGDSEHCRAEPQRREYVAPSERDPGPGPQGEGVLGAPESDPAGGAQAAEVTITATGEAREHAAKDQDGLAGLERREKEGSLQVRQEVGAAALTQEDVTEGDSTMAEKLSEEVIDEDSKKEAGKASTLGTLVMKDGHAEGNGGLQGGVVVAKENLPEGGAAEMAKEQREVLADLKTAEKETEANTTSSFSDMAGEETWHKVNELLGKTAAAEKMVAEEIALSREEVTVTGASKAMTGEPAGLEGKGGEAGTSPLAESIGEEAGNGSFGGGLEAGEAEDFRLGLSEERESELSRESLQDVVLLPVKADCPGTQEKQEHSMQRERKNTVVCLNNKDA
ncbi:glutamate-rich protein 3 [Rhynchonycteris naso]